MIAKRSPSIGSKAIIQEQDYPLVLAYDAQELLRLIEHLHGKGWLRSGPLPKTSGEPTPSNVIAKAELTVAGWDEVERIGRTALSGRQAFVAMWFEDSFHSAWTDGFHPALASCGYEPIRIDQVEFTGKIDDAVIAAIRSSSLVIADLSGHRQSVYFEIGFATGLSIPIILTCREDHIGDIHFDIRQHNVIKWNNEKSLRALLEKRVLALYPLKPQQ